jgi:hypothetical protein
VLKASRALVALSPGDALRVAPSTARPSADFLAHLIATSGQAPQTRLRRRAEPEEAIAAYRALGQWPTPPGGALSRSL